MSVPAARAVYRQYSSSSNTNGSSENLPPRTLTRLAREVRDLHKNPPEGLRLVVDDESGVPTNLSEIMAEMEGPTGTPYENKFFLLKLVFSQDFPSTPPRGFFLTKIYHPNVDMTTGAICVNTLKKDWTSETTVAHVLAVIRCLLIVPFPESSLNDEAGKMFMESYHEYSKRARLMADVHGRPMSACCDTNNNSDNTSNSNGGSSSSPTADKNTDARVLKSSSDNPQRNSNNNKKVSKQPSSGAGKMSKKKSLKRL